MNSGIVISGNRWTGCDQRVPRLDLHWAFLNQDVGTD